MFSFEFAIKLPRKRKYLKVQGDFDKIVDTNRSKLCEMSAINHYSLYSYVFCRRLL